VPAPVAEQMLAVLREALSNIAKHAQADTVSITVTAEADDVELLVRDNGVGMPADPQRSGLANMAVRARDLGGSFDARSADVGTVVTWRVPLDQ
jgi:signal transduction histidine kinase